MSLKSRNLDTVVKSLNKHKICWEIINLICINDKLES